MRVVVYDKLERPQPLGSGLILQPVGLHVVDDIGVGDRVRALGAVIERLFGRVVPSQNVVLNVRYDAFGREAPTGVAVHQGEVYILEYTNANGSPNEGWRPRVRKLGRDGKVTTLVAAAPEPDKPERK